MRKILVRVWDFNIKKMYPTTSTAYTLKNGHTMLFTGFNDKNGKPIYEGDIISDLTDTEEGVKKSYKQVFWNESKAAFHVDDSFSQDKTSSSDLWWELETFSCEISGNIYENPQLLAFQ
jgi:uncharacterized phage protein (TIGR01671 family)